MSFICITPMGHPRKKCSGDVGETRLLPTPGTQGRLGWATRGRQPGRSEPAPRYGRVASAAPPFWAPGVGELRAGCVWPPERRGRARAIAHTLRPAASTGPPLVPAVPRRLGQASAPGWGRALEWEWRAAGMAAGPDQSPRFSLLPHLAVSPNF